MSAVLQQYLARSPRFVLDPKEKTLLRVAGPQLGTWEESTEIKNISASGLAFLAPADLSPQLGELIKVQVSLGTLGPFAFHALVTRIEKLKEHWVIATQFVRMLPEQKLVWQQYLESLGLELGESPPLNPSKNFIDYIKDQAVWVRLTLFFFVAWVLALTLVLWI